MKITVIWRLVICWIIAVIRDANAHIHVPEDNPTIWNAIAETSKRIFPQHQTIFVTLPLRVADRDLVNTQLAFISTKVKLNTDGPCSIEQPEIHAYYCTLNKTRIRHTDKHDDYNKIIIFNISYIEDIILKKIHDICTKPVLVSPLKDSHMIPGLLHKKSFILLLKLGYTDDENNYNEYDMFKMWRDVLFVFKYSTVTFDAGSRFLVAIIDVPCSKEKVRKIFRTMGANGININDVYILTQGSKPGSMDLFTWYPYELPSGECGKLMDAVLIDTWIEGEDGGRFVKNLNFSLNKTPTHLANCCLNFHKVPVVTYGVQREIVRLVSRKMNRDSKTCKEDIEVVSLLQAWTHQEFSVRFSTFNYRFFIPASESYFSWSNITDVFHVSAWLFVIFSFLTAAFFVKWLAGSPHFLENPGYNEITRCLISSWSVLLGIGDSISPKCAPMRIFLFSWILYSMCISTVFQAFFNSYFVVPGRQDQIDSVVELAETNTTFLFVSLDTFWRFSSAYELAHRAYFLPMTDAYKYMIRTPNTAIFSNSLEFSYCMKQFCRKQTPHIYHKLSGDLMQVDDYMTTLDPLIRPHFIKIVTQLVEGGIPEKLMRDEFTPSGDTTNMFELQKVNNNFFALSFLHLWSAFGLLLTLHVASLLVFIFEQVFTATKK